MYSGIIASLYDYKTTGIYGCAPCVGLLFSSADAFGTAVRNRSGRDLEVFDLFYCFSGNTSVFCHFGSFAYQAEYRNGNIPQETLSASAAYGSSVVADNNGGLCLVGQEILG